LLQARDMFCEKRHYFVHIGNAIVLCAINQTDMLNLRALSIIASSFGVLYNLLQPTPLLAPAAWGLFFISCHVYYMAELLRERQQVVLTPDKEKVYEMAFLRFGFTPRQFCDILEKAQARWYRFSEGEFVNKRGDTLRDINFLVEGEVHMISATGDYVKRFSPGKGAWLGEFFDPNMTEQQRARFLLEEQTHCMSWKCASRECRTLALSKRLLHEHFEANPRLKEAALSAQVYDLWGKLHRSIPESRRLAYQQMLEVALSDGTVDDRERALLEAWRERHRISEQDHVAFLAALSWSEDEFRAGRRRRRPR